MRVALIAPPWLPVPAPSYGGIEAMVDLLARGLASAGHEVVLFTTGDATCDVPRAWAFAEAVGVGEGGSAAEARHVIEAYDHPAVRSADIVHDHTIIGPLYRPHVAGPTVVTAHGPFWSDCGSCYAASRDAAIVAISRHQASCAGATPIAAVIHHGIDVAAVPVGSGGGGYAAFLGRMHPDKGVADACRIARRAGVPLVIAAKMREPIERAYFDEVVRPLLGAGVEYIGEIDAGEKWRFLGEATCLLNPVAWPEPFGLVMIEALATGTPVVATPVGSVPELVTDGVTGVVGPARRLADRIHEAKAVDRRRCRLEAERRFSAQRMVDEHVALYERLSSGGRPRPDRGLRDRARRGVGAGRG